MTTLPPEGNEQSDGTPHEAPSVPTAPPEQAAGAPGPLPGNQPSFGEGETTLPPAPPASTPPSYAAPQQPGYSQQQQPSYQQPHPQGDRQHYSQGQQPYTQGQQPQQNPLQNLTANYWLSVFFLWIPALIFFLVESPRASAQVRALHAANLNFSLLRTALMVFGWVLIVIPGIGGLALAVGHIGGFVLHIIAATKVSETYQRGGTDPFLFNAPMVK